MGKQKKEPLSNPQRKRVWELIQQVGLDPHEFKFEEVESSYFPGCMVDQLVHPASQFYYTFDCADVEEESMIVRSVYQAETSPASFTLQCDDWNHMLGNLSRWLRYIKQNADVADPWESLAREASILELPAVIDMPDTGFTSREQHNISEILLRLENRLTEVAGQQQAVTNAIGDLKRASRRTDRRAFRYMLIGVLCTILASLSQVQRVRDAVTDAWHELEQIVQGVLPP